MENYTGVEQELEKSFFAYMDAYFVHRDETATFALLSPLLTGFGTGADENAYTAEALRALFQRDFAQAPNPIHYEMIEHRVVVYPGGPKFIMGVVMSEFNISTRIMDQSVKLNNLRLSLLFSKHEGVWLIEHKHISLPTFAHELDEAYPIKELEERTQVLERMVRNRTRDLEEAKRNLEKLAITDRLTGIYNRMKIDELLEQCVNHAKRYDSCFSVIMMDIDHFKRINDNHGHQMGDRVLMEISSLLSKRIRKTDFVGRWGGEEFLILCTETCRLDARNLAEELRTKIMTAHLSGELQVTASFGVTQYQSSEELEVVVERADSAMYAAKRNGRNRVEIS